MKLSIIPVLFALAFLLVPPMSSFGATGGTFGSFSTIVNDGQDHFISDTVIDGDNIYMLYTVGQDDGDLYFISSNDEGDNWNTPVLIEDTQHYTSSYVKDRIFVNSNDDILIVYSTITPDSNVNSRVSTDGGLTFGAEVTKTNEGVTFYDDMQISNDGDNVLFLFGDDGFTFSGAIVSNDFGSSWNDVVDFGANDTNYRTGEVRGSDMFVVYHHYFSGTDTAQLEFVKSDDDGLTWDAPIILSTLPTQYSWNPYFHVSDDGSTLYVDWTDENNQNVLKATSTNGGASWSSEVSVANLDSECADTYWTTGFDGDNVNFLCGDGDDSLGYYTRQSTDGGVTFDSLTLVDFTDNIPSDEYPRQHLTGSNYMFINYDVSDPNDVSFLSYSQDSGGTWQTYYFLDRNGTFPTLDTEVEIDDWLTDSVGELFIYFDANTTGLIEFLKGDIPNFGLESDTTPPVISATSQEPITIIQGDTFLPFEHVTCIDDVDGDITNNMDYSPTPDTSIRGTVNVDYQCIDFSTNQADETIQYIIKKKSTGGSSGGSSGGTSGGQQSTSSIPQLSDIPVLSFSGDADSDSDSEGQSISDLFANLFDNRITEGITTPTQSQGSNPLGASGDSSQRPNPITEFLQNLFAGFFN